MQMRTHRSSVCKVHEKYALTLKNEDPPGIE